MTVVTKTRIADVIFELFGSMLLRGGELDLPTVIWLPSPTLLDRKISKPESFG
jgi:hypothetical protein